MKLVTMHEYLTLPIKKIKRKQKVDPGFLDQLLVFSSASRGDLFNFMVEVREKNNEIESMLQNIDQGFFTILPDLTIHLTYSDQLKDIFQTSEIARKKVMDLLFI